MAMNSYPCRGVRHVNQQRGWLGVCFNCYSANAGMPWMPVTRRRRDERIQIMLVHQALAQLLQLRGLQRPESDSQMWLRAGQLVQMVTLAC